MLFSHKRHFCLITLHSAENDELSINYAATNVTGERTYKILLRDTKIIKIIMAENKSEIIEFSFVYELGDKRD